MGNITLKKPLFRRKLYLSDSPYFMERTEEEGEQDLFKIVKNAKREHNWTFFPETTTWVSHTPEYAVDDDGLSVTIQLLGDTPFGTEQVYYHIHPDRMWAQANEKNVRQAIRKIDDNLEDELIRIFRALPSEADYVGAAEKMDGKEMRVLSSLGVFSLKGHNNPTNSNYVDYNLFVANSLKIETLREAGIVPAIQEIVENMNANSSNYVSLSFRPRN